MKWTVNCGEKNKLFLFTYLQKIKIPRKLALIERYKAELQEELWGAFSLLNMHWKFLAWWDERMEWEKYKLYLAGIAVKECLCPECTRKNHVNSILTFYFTRNQTEQECPLFHTQMLCRKPMVLKLLFFFQTDMGWWFWINIFIWKNMSSNVHYT